MASGWHLQTSLTIMAWRCHTASTRSCGTQLGLYTHVFLVSMAAHRDQHTYVLAVALIVGLYTWQTKNKWFNSKPIGSITNTWQTNWWIANKWFNSSPQQSHAVWSRWVCACTASAEAWEKKEWFLGWWCLLVHAMIFFPQNTLSTGSVNSFELMCTTKHEFTNSKKCSLLLSFHDLWFTENHILA